MECLQIVGDTFDRLFVEAKHPTGLIFTCDSSLLEEVWFETWDFPINDDLRGLKLFPLFEFLPSVLSVYLQVAEESYQGLISEVFQPGEGVDLIVFVLAASE